MPRTIKRHSITSSPLASSPLRYRSRLASNALQLTQRRVHARPTPLGWCVRDAARDRVLRPERGQHLLQARVEEKSDYNETESAYSPPAGEDTESVLEEEEPLVERENEAIDRLPVTREQVPTPRSSTGQADHLPSTIPVEDSVAKFIAARKIAAGKKRQSRENIENHRQLLHGLNDTFRDLVEAWEAVADDTDGLGGYFEAAFALCEQEVEDARTELKKYRGREGKSWIANGGFAANLAYAWYTERFAPAIRVALVDRGDRNMPRTPWAAEPGLRDHMLQLEEALVYAEVSDAGKGDLKPRAVRQWCVENGYEGLPNWVVKFMD